MAEAALKIDPDFVPEDPTPANFFAWHPLQDNPEETRRLIRETCDGWKEACQQLRVTLISENPRPNDVGKGYPPGIWIEGWESRTARQLPFGAPWPNKDSAIYPALTADHG